MALLLIYTRTRGAWVGLIVGTAAALVYTYRQGTPLWVGIRPSRAALPVILEQLLKNFFSSSLVG